MILYPTLIIYDTDLEDKNLCNFIEPNSWHFINQFHSTMYVSVFKSQEIAPMFSQISRGSLLPDSPWRGSRLRH